MVKRKREGEGGIEREVVVLSGEVELLVQSQSWAGAAAKLRQKSSLPRIGCLQNISNVARGRWSKSHLRVRRRVADSSRYGYWPWTAKVGFYILADFAPQAS